MRLLDVQWRRGSLPGDHAAVAGMLRGLGLTPELARQCRLAVVLRLFPVADGRRGNPLLHAEREDARRRTAANTERARAAALARWRDGHGEAEG